LYGRDGRAAVLQDDLHFLIVQGIRLGVGKAVYPAHTVAGLPLDGAFEQPVDIVGLALLLEGLYYPMDLVVVDERAVHSRREAAAWRQVEHIALPEQGFRPHLVEYGARVDF